MNKFGAEEIIKLFKDLEKQINELWCFVEKCCSKIPINIGNGVGIYKRFRNDKWEFKSLIAGNNVTITEQDNTITVNSTAEPFTCEDVNTCLGISEEGDANKYLNEQGNFVAVGGGGFTCSDLSSCSTTNLLEGDNLYFTNTRAINALGGTPNYVNYYHSTTGLITGDQYFTRLNTGRTRIWGDITGQDGGYLELTPIGTSYFGAINGGSLDNYFWVNGGNIGWAWNSVQFTLPTTDGNSGDVLITNGAGILSFQTPTTGLITAIADTNTVDLVDTAGTLTANVRHQDTTTINLSDDASGLKADFASMNISQFTNDSGYTTNTGTVTSVSALTLGTTGTDLSSTVANSTTTPVITLNVPTASAANRGVLSSTDWSTFNNKIGGSGTTNEIAYFSGSSTISSLSTGTYPSLTELSYVKGVTGSVQTQLDAKQDLILKASLSSGNVTLTNTLTATNLTGLSFSVDANTRYYIFGQIDCGSANASGIKWAINAPAATTLDVNLFGLTSATTSFRSEMITSLTTLTTSSIPAANTTQGFVYLSGTIETGANSGTVQIQWATVSNYTITAYKLGTGLFLIKL